MNRKTLHRTLRRATALLAWAVLLSCRAGSGPAARSGPTLDVFLSAGDSWWIGTCVTVLFRSLVKHLGSLAGPVAQVAYYCPDPTSKPANRCDKTGGFGFLTPLAVVDSRACGEASPQTG